MNTVISERRDYQSSKYSYQELLEIKVAQNLPIGQFNLIT